MFPVPIIRKEHSVKSWVIGIQVGETYKAYPLSILNIVSDGVLIDTVGNIPINIQYNPKSQSVKVTNQKTKAIIPHVKLYWFAWQAFYPETELYKPTG